MKTVSIGFSAPRKTKIGAEIIKLYMGTSYSHVYLKVSSKWSYNDIIIQASHGKVHCVSNAKFSADNQIIAEFRYALSDEAFKKLYSYCIDNLQANYGYFGLIKLALRPFLRTKGDGERSFHCSEFALRALPVQLNVDPDYATPKHLYNYLQYAKDVERVV